MRKQRRQPSFATLTDAEIEQIAQSLDGATYADVRARVNQPRSAGGFGLNLTTDRPLELLWRRTKTIEKINAHITQGEKLTLATFDAITAGEDSASEEIQDAILFETMEAVRSGGNSPHQLLALQRLADFPERATLRAQRAELDHRKFEHKIGMDDFRKHIATERLALHQRRLQLTEKKIADDAAKSAKSKTVPAPKQEDELGPFATNWDEIGERARISHGVSKEEWARRQALHDRCEEPLTTPDLNPDLLPLNHPPGFAPGSPPSSQESPPTPHSAPADLLSTVRAYNVQRAEEYWTWRRLLESLPNGASAPPFSTQHRHCPCGQASPCPVHEHEPYGEFPDWFWSVSPHLAAYTLCLTARHLPSPNMDEHIPKEFILYANP